MYSVFIICYPAAYLLTTLEEGGHFVLFLNQHTNLQSYDIGDYSYGSPIDILDLVDDVTLKIGKYCSIAAGVRILLGADHRTDWVTTYPFNILYSDIVKNTGHPASKGNIIIGNDVWIASGAVLLSGVTIGDGAVIGANAVVTKDVEPYSIVAGNPATFIKKRFSDQVIASLLTIKWWCWSDDEVRQAVPHLLSNDILGFIQYAERRGG